MHILQGIRKAIRRWPLTLLLYLVGLALAALLAVPVFRAVHLVLGSSGFSPDLAERFDMVLWIDFLEKGRAALLGATWQLFLAVPLFIVWKVASQVGLVWALRGDGEASFWEGVSRFALRAFLLALVFLFLAGFGTAIIWVMIAVVLDALDEPATYWTVVAIGPVLTILVLGTLDLMHDYARIRLVLRGTDVWESFFPGSLWPFRRLSALLLYDFWFFVAALLWVIPFWFDGLFAKQTIVGMLIAFAAQQVIIFARNGARVAWIGSEVSYFEDKSEPESEFREDFEETDGEKGVDAGGKPLSDPPSAGMHPEMGAEDGIEPTSTA